jgi:hypothetical protein
MALELTPSQLHMVDSSWAPVPMEMEAATAHTDNVYRRKARRAPRSAEKRAHSKPYSALTWQERRDLELKEAAAAAAAAAVADGARSSPYPVQKTKSVTAINSNSYSNSYSNSNCNSANRVDGPVTEAEIGAVQTLSCSTPLTMHKSKRRRGRRCTREQPPPAPRNLTQFIVAEHQSPDEPADPVEYLCSNVDGRQDSTSSCDTSADTFFDKTYEESLYDDLRHLSHEGLIDRIRARDRELEMLHEQLRALRAAHATP